MNKYEELYKHAKYVFDEEVSRFGRVEDKAARFITVVTSLLAVYALAGKELFGELLPTENCTEKTLITLAALVLVGLLFSWGFAFKAMHIQGIKKAPLNENILSFFNDNELIDIYYGMSKQFSTSLLHNRAVNDLKAKNIKRSFWSIVFTVIFFSLFIFVSAINAYSVKPENGAAEVILQRGDEVKASLLCKPNPNFKEEASMIGNGNDGEAEPKSPEQPQESPSQKPNLEIVVPDFDIVTESFDPSDLPTNEASEE